MIKMLTHDLNSIESTVSLMCVISLCVSSICHLATASNFWRKYRKFPGTTQSILANFGRVSPVFTNCQDCIV